MGFRALTEIQHWGNFFFLSKNLSFWCYTASRSAVSLSQALFLLERVLWHTSSQEPWQSGAHGNGHHGALSNASPPRSSGLCRGVPQEVMSFSPFQYASLQHKYSSHIYSSSRLYSSLRPGKRPHLNFWKLIFAVVNFFLLLCSF